MGYNWAGVTQHVSAGRQAGGWLRALGQAGGRARLQAAAGGRGPVGRRVVLRRDRQAGRQAGGQGWGALQLSSASLSY